VDKNLQRAVMKGIRDEIYSGLTEIGTLLTKIRQDNYLHLDFSRYGKSDTRFIKFKEIACQVKSRMEALENLADIFYATGRNETDFTKLK
jgi:hypothetical protein